MNYSNHQTLSKSLKTQVSHYGQMLEKDVLRKTSTVAKKIATYNEDQDERERLQYDIDNDLLMGEDAFLCVGV